MERITAETDLIVRSKGISKWMSNGREQNAYGPQYIHFNETCLRSYDSLQDKDVVYAEGETFDFSRITVDGKTEEIMTDNQINDLRGFGIII